MKQTVTANISGIVFHIEVDAYKKLNDYLEKIKGYFEDSGESEEILADIEARIAELLNPKINESNQVIRMKDVDEVIEIMGRPEQYIQDEPGEEEESGRQTSSRARSRRRIFRDPDDRLLGGVASGLSHFFGIDPVFMRLFFVIALLMGFGFLTYIILWIVIPEARTASEKLQMKGEPVNIENIGKTFKKGAREFEEKMKNFNEKGWSRRVENFFQSVGDMFASLFRAFFAAFGKLLGIVFIAVGVFFAIAFLGGWLTSETMWLALSPSGFMSVESEDIFQTIFMSEEQLYYAKIALIAVLGIPVLGLILGGLKLLLGIRGNLGIGIGLGIAWVFALIVCIFIGFQIGLQFKAETSIFETETLFLPGDQIVLKLSDEVIPGEEFIMISDDDFFLNTDSAQVYYSNLELDIRRSRTDSLQIELERIGRGLSRKMAAEKARNIGYNFQQDANMIIFDPYLYFPKSDKIRGQEFKIVLRLPVGKRIYLDPSMENIIYNIQNVTNTYDDDMLGHTWEMMEDGLTCLDCDFEVIED